MCGRYALYGLRKRTRAEAEYFPSLDQFPSKWNVAPTDTMPIARVQDGELELAPARWGLIPYYSKDAKGAFRCINARAETVATTASFRQPWKTGRRCLVPANGFFEWETRPDGKQPFYFTSAEGSLLAFAGLWDTWRQPDGSSLLSFTIFTTAPNDFVKRFHDRMPVILDEADYARWLTGADVSDLLKAPHNEVLLNYPVSRHVNSVKNNDASLIESIDDAHPGHPAPTPIR